ncbi:unnamed protein product [Pipistrellus nathusii]|uniref:Uncharacterized protein n=1 Tax=Pipistrellus nathusii TaxID=59473 RepID=A0ABP0A7F5_PIPNA
MERPQEMVQRGDGADRSGRAGPPSALGAGSAGGGGQEMGRSLSLPGPHLQVTHQLAAHCQGLDSRWQPCPGQSLRPTCGRAGTGGPVAAATLQGRGSGSL